MKIDHNLNDSDNNIENKPASSLGIELIYWIARIRAHTLPAKNAVRFLLLLDNRLYSLHGGAAIRYGEGIHPKHRHTKYHDFFVNRITGNEKILDVGCGIGAVAHAVAMRTGATVVGIDINQKNIEIANATNAYKNIRYIFGDALMDLPNEKFDVVILSNVLEHVQNRVNFLIQLLSITSASRLLIRVPLFERDWRVPLKKELGIDYRLDPTHYIEYTHESFFEEMKEAGLKIIHLESRWGEIWAEAIPRT